MKNSISVITFLLLTASMLLTPAAHAAPSLVVEPPVYQVGTVVEGEKAQALFIVRNTRLTPIHIREIQAACGCTEAKMDDMTLQPGGFTRLTVSVDTRIKLGLISKSVHLIDDAGNVTTALIKMEVKSHAMPSRDSSLFSGKCASCHATPANKLSDGRRIYQAICQMCHGPEARGGYAPSLRKIKDAETLTALIRYGNGRQMPGYAKSEGGPLTDKQIRAVVQWLQRLP